MAAAAVAVVAVVVVVGLQQEAVEMEDWPRSLV